MSHSASVLLNKFLILTSTSHFSKTNLGVRKLQGAQQAYKKNQLPLPSRFPPLTFSFSFLPFPLAPLPSALAPLPSSYPFLSYSSPPLPYSHLLQLTSPPLPSRSPFLTSPLFQLPFTPSPPLPSPYPPAPIPLLQLPSPLHTSYPASLRSPPYQHSTSYPLFSFHPEILGEFNEIIVHRA